jgi:protoporphyrinogen/coproporphyrinogen III oxidase
MRWTLPRVAGLERRYGSVLRGLREAKRAGTGSGSLRQPSISFRDGLKTLVERLATSVGDVRTGARVDAVRRAEDGFLVESTAGSFSSRRVVVAVPAPQAACLVHPASAGKSAALAEVPYAPMAVLALGFRREQVAHPLDGFGFLAAPGNGLRLLGCLFASSIFPGRAPAGRVLLTCFLGGRLAPDVVRRDEPELLAIAREDLARALGVTGEPELTLVRRWERAIPQYELGHDRFVRLEAEMPGLRFAGNWLEGAGVADCAERGAKAAAALAAIC